MKIWIYSKILIPSITPNNHLLVVFKKAKYIYHQKGMQIDIKDKKMECKKKV